VPDSPDQIRKDLIKRLFAVAIGVGVGFTLSRMSWVEDANGHFPKFAEWQQLAILAAAMTATVLSWDGYLISIENRPLTGFARFAIDVVLVFIYMLLIMTSRHQTWWLTIHALTYAIYVVWDFLTTREHTSKFYPENYQGRKSSLDIYWRGLRDVTPRESAGPIITINWAAYFCALWFINRIGLEERIFVTALFVLVGLISYRLDKTYRWTMIVRFGVVVALVLADLLYIHCGNNFNDLWFGKFLPSYIG
jgi:Ca2+/Na+ antiporter